MFVILINLKTYDLHYHTEYFLLLYKFDDMFYEFQVYDEINNVGLDFVTLGISNFISFKSIGKDNRIATLLSLYLIVSEIIQKFDRTKFEHA